MASSPRSRITSLNRHQNRASFAVQSRSLLQHARLPDSTAVTSSISAHTAASLIRRGLGEDEHMRRLAYALNMSLLLCHLKALPEALQAATDAQDALMIAHSCSHAVKRWIIHDELFEIICRALTAYDRQLVVASRAQIIAADCELGRLQAAAYPESRDIGSTTPAVRD